MRPEAPEGSKEPLGWMGEGREGREGREGGGGMKYLRAVCASLPVQAGVGRAWGKREGWREG